MCIRLMDTPSLFIRLCTVSILTVLHHTDHSKVSFLCGIMGMLYEV